MNVYDLTKSNFSSVFRIERINNEVKVHSVRYSDNKNIELGKYFKVDSYKISCPIMYGDDNTSVDRVLYTELCKCAVVWTFM